MKSAYNPDIEQEQKEQQSRLDDLELEFDRYEEKLINKTNKLKRMIKYKDASKRQKHIWEQKLAVTESLYQYIYYHDTNFRDTYKEALIHSIEQNPFYKESTISCKFSTTKKLADKILALGEKYCALLKKLRPAYLTNTFLSPVQLSNSHDTLFSNKSRSDTFNSSTRGSSPRDNEVLRSGPMMLYPVSSV